MRFPSQILLVLLCLGGLAGGIALAGDVNGLLGGLLGRMNDASTGSATTHASNATTVGAEPEPYAVVAGLGTLTTGESDPRLVIGTPSGFTVGTSAGSRTMSAGELSEWLASRPNDAPPVTVTLGRGVYGDPLVLDGVRDVTIRGQPGAVLAGGDPPQIVLEDVQMGEGGLIDWKPQYQSFNAPGLIDIKNSHDVRIEGLTVQNGWPNGVRVVDSQGVTIHGLELIGGTNGVYVTGHGSRDVTIEDSTWIQDPTGAIWDRLDWASVHHGSLGYYNGAFVQGRDVAGLTVRNNRIENAFNGVRIKNKKALPEGSYDGERGRRYVIENNEFYRVSDNAIELEAHISDATLRGNRVEGFHAPLSFDGVEGENIFVEDNTLVATERARQNLDHPTDGIRHNGSPGRAFKLKSDTPTGTPEIDNFVVTGNTLDLRESTYPVLWTRGVAWPEGAKVESNRTRGGERFEETENDAENE